MIRIGSRAARSFSTTRSCCWQAQSTPWPGRTRTLFLFALAADDQSDLPADADLAHKADNVIEQLLFNDLVLVPAGNSAEIDCERLPGRSDLPSVAAFHRSRHRSGEPRNRAGPIAAGEQNAVRAVVNPIVGKCLEHLHALRPVIVPSMRWRLRRPSDDGVGVVPFVERVPVLCVPRIV